MPWSDHYERRPAVINRVIALIILGLILGWSARSWFIGSAAVG
jgi:hypothetical protein